MKYKTNYPKELTVLGRWKKNQFHKTLTVPLCLRAEEDYVYYHNCSVTTKIKLNENKERR